MMFMSQSVERVIQNFLQGVNVGSVSFGLVEVRGASSRIKEV